MPELSNSAVLEDVLAGAANVVFTSAALAQQLGLSPELIAQLQQEPTKE